jgi:hypothetical protein
LSMKELALIGNGILVSSQNVFVLTPQCRTIWVFMRYDGTRYTRHTL